MGQSLDAARKRQNTNFERLILNYVELYMTDIATKILIKIQFRTSVRIVLICKANVPERVLSTLAKVTSTLGFSKVTATSAPPSHGTPTRLRPATTPNRPPNSEFSGFKFRLVAIVKAKTRNSHNKKKPLPFRRAKGVATPSRPPPSQGP